MGILLVEPLEPPVWFMPAFVTAGLFRLPGPVPFAGFAYMGMSQILAYRVKHQKILHKMGYFLSTNIGSTYQVSGIKYLVNNPYYMILDTCYHEEH